MTEDSEIAYVKAVGAEMRDIRERLGWTREEAVAALERLGHVLGVRTLLSYEHGTRVMSVGRLYLWGEVYGVPASMILAAAAERAGRPQACRSCGRP